ncbi:Lrp/AsnC family transcriptional regulator [Micrococcales bacterium 31B]|nr:Lrp/AsnC family transcriptional regulator [Micrococcales bacterium 31B]
MPQCDDTDRALIRALLDDPRATFVALAQRLGLSRNTVQSRVQRLEDSGVFTAMDGRVNAASLGYPLAAFVAVHARQRRLHAIVAELATVPEVLQVHGLSGQIDLLVHVVCRDAEDLFRIDGVILRIEGVERTETSLSMGELLPYRVGPLLGVAR